MEISIIVPVYNVEKTLCRCLDSILKQTFQDFEVILVDDGSTDSGGLICDEYAKNDSRISVVHKENGGLSSARNAGLKIAQGKYVMFCDSDDYVSSKWCELMLSEIRLHPEAWIVCDVARVDDAGIVKNIESDISVKKKWSYFDIYKLGVSAYAWNKIYRKDYLSLYKIEFDERCRFAEDVEFNVKYCACCNEVIFINEKLYYYVQVDGSIMNRYYPDWMELHLPLFYCRIPLLNLEELKEYCDIWLYRFNHMFNSVFDKRNTMSFWQKLKFNQKMINSKEFKFCVENATGKYESPIFMKILRMHNYYVL